MKLMRKRLLSHFGVASLLLSAVVATGEDQAVSQARKSTNQNTGVQSAQDALLQKLLERVEQLEQAGAEKAESVRKSQEERIEKLLGRISELEGKVKTLEAGRGPNAIVTPSHHPTARELEHINGVPERSNVIAAEAAEVRANEAPRLSVGQNGFVLSSADTNFVLKFRGLLHLDSRSFFHDNARSEGNDGFLLRRARPIIEGTVFRDFDFTFTPDFGGASVAIQDAWLNYRGAPGLQLRVGKYKSPVGFEALQSDAALPFNERGFPTALVPNRNLGLQVWGELAEGAASYAAGVFDQTGDARNPANTDFNDAKEFAGRIFLQPFKHSRLTGLRGLGFGLGGSYSQITSNALALPNTTGGTAPGYFTDGQQQFFAYQPAGETVVADGVHWRLSPQASYLHGPVGFLGEYVISHQAVLNSSTHRRAELAHTAWQISAQWVLTGEPASFNGLTPRHPLDFRGGSWGAWQLVARFGRLDIDNATFSDFSNPDNSASLATAWSVGINWWLNKNVRFLTSFSHTIFDGGGTFNPLDPSTLIPPATVTQQDENVLFTRLQLAF